MISFQRFKAISIAVMLASDVGVLENVTQKIMWFMLK